MKRQIIAFMIISILVIVTSCEKDEEKIEPQYLIVGEWIYEYQLLDDGSKEYDNPYALLEFGYSDGFILNKDNTGHSVWYNKTNGDFEWRIDNSKLIISVTRSDDSIDYFEYQISNLDKSSMEFETFNGTKYLMKKQ